MLTASQVLVPFLLSFSLIYYFFFHLLNTRACAQACNIAFSFFFPFPFFPPELPTFISPESIFQGQFKYSSKTVDVPRPSGLHTFAVSLPFQSRRFTPTVRNIVVEIRRHCHHTRIYIGMCILLSRCLLILAQGKRNPDGMGSTV